MKNSSNEPKEQMETTPATAAPEPTGENGPQPTFAPDAIEAAVRSALGQSSAADADRNRFDRAVEGARVRRDHSRKEGSRNRPADLGGARLKLGVQGTIPGYHMYWENDEDGAIEQLLYAGFDFVSPEEVQMSSAFVSDADLGHRISRFVGRKEDGSPLRAYLLKCPDEVWADREESRYAQADIWDADIKAGRVQHDEGRYMPKGAGINLNTQFRKEH